jgi:DNA-binding winged helix-turn-helix (wHTH) protein
MMLMVPADAAYTDADTLQDLERGADGVHLCHDSWRLFLAKVGAYLRRAGHDVSRRGVYRVGAVELDADIREVKVEGQRVQLSAKPFALLEAFMRAPSKIFSRSELVDLVWGPDFAVGEHTLDVHVHALRRELDRDPHRRCRLINIKNVGFKLKAAAPSARPLVSSRVEHEVVPFTSTPIRRSLTADRCGKDLEEISLSLRAGQKAWIQKRSRRRQARPNGKAVAERYLHHAASAG